MRHLAEREAPPGVRRLLAGFTTGLLGMSASFAQQPASFPELQARSGLPNLAAKSDQAGELRAAYLGGSITAANGWRVGTREFLRREYPGKQVKEIMAGVPGTGSDTGACRLQRDVLSRQPDLLFVEFAVNDFGWRPERVIATMEGIVRQTKATNPQTDMIFVYTIDERSLADLSKGQIQKVAGAMEKVADHYGIPSINFAAEVYRRLQEGKLVFTGPKDSIDANGHDPQNRLVYSHDRVHPSDAGHKIAAEAVVRSWPALIEAGKKSASSPAMPAALSPSSWENATLFGIDKASLSGEWKRIPPEDESVKTQAPGLTPPVLKAMEPGSAVEFRFNGTDFGLYSVKTPEAGRFRVHVDDLPPVEGTFFDHYCTVGRPMLTTWFYPRPLPPGDHQVKIELLEGGPDKAAIMAAAKKPAPTDDAYSRNGLYLAGIFLNGQLH